MEVEDLNDLGITINWMTRAELEDRGYGSAEPWEKVYQTIQQAVQ